MYDVTKRKSSIILTLLPHYRSYALLLVPWLSIHLQRSRKNVFPVVHNCSQLHFPSKQPPEIMANNSITNTDNNDSLQFDNLLNLEDQYYQEGLELGIADGQKAGRIEGRLFGIEKGFEKFFFTGEMNGRASFLFQQIPSEPPSAEAAGSTHLEAEEKNAKLKALLERFEEVVQQAAANNIRVRAEEEVEDHGQRLTKQIISLFDLTDPATLSSLNTEEAIDDFDERKRRAKAKLIMIDQALDAKARTSSSAVSSNKADVASGSSSLAMRGAGSSVRLVRNDTGTTEKNIEDFGA